jgi:aryl-alcohol dehydrogenase-like predicted oxidoreductase
MLVYVLDNGVDAMALIGPHTVAQLQDSMQAADAFLSHEDLAHLTGD